MPEWGWQILIQAGPYALSLALGLGLGWLWGQSRQPPPPPGNPWGGAPLPRLGRRRALDGVRAATSNPRWDQGKMVIFTNSVGKWAVSGPGGTRFWQPFERRLRGDGPPLAIPPARKRRAWVGAMSRRRGGYGRAARSASRAAMSITTASSSIMWASRGSTRPAHSSFTRSSVAPAWTPQTALCRPATNITNAKGIWTAGAGCS
jgi:hypothetical protein